MSDSLTPDLVRAVRAGCNKVLDFASHGCSFPKCDCRDFPDLLRAALAELEKPSEEMLDVFSDPDEADRLLQSPEWRGNLWRAIMRKVLGGEP